MVRIRVWIGFSLLLLSCAVPALAQQPAGSAANPLVPPLVSFSGSLADLNGKPLSGTVGVTFFLYKDQQGGSPLWIETQNVQSDKSGHYSVMLGSTTSSGLPSDIFVAGEARWLGVQPQGQAEQSRVMLLSVPYALKAADAQTFGGLPPSAFVLTAPIGVGSASPSSSASASGTAAAPPVGGSGTKNFIPIWTDNIGDLGNSVLFQTGTGSTAKLGINTTVPASTLDVKGGGTFRGVLNLPATGLATAAKGFNSQPLNSSASAFNSGTSSAVTQTFQWQAEPVGNNTSNPAGSLNLLFGQGANKPSETGLNIASNGQINFASGQTFPGTGTITGVTAGAGLSGGGNGGNVTLSVASSGITNTMLQNSSLTVNPGGGMTGGGKISLGGTASLGLQSCSTNQVLEFVGGVWTCATAGTGTITGVTAGTGLTGGGTSGNVTLNLDTTKVPLLATANTFTANQTIDGSLAVASNTTYQPFSVQTSSSFGTWLELGNTSAGGHTWNILSAGGGNAEGAGNLGITDLTGTSTIWLEGKVNVASLSAGSPNSPLLQVSGNGPNAVVLVNATVASTQLPGMLVFGGNSGSTTAASDGIDVGGGNNCCGGGNGGAGLNATGGGSGGVNGGPGGTFTGGFGNTNNFFADGDGIDATNGDGGFFETSFAYAGNFAGDINVSGAVFAATKDFKIDHPLDPANEYLFHASVESSEMKTIYDGVATLDASGSVVVEMPGWFEALNGDFRYQLTPVGAPGPGLYVARKISRNRFTIAGGTPGAEVSWQVTGVRHDAYARANPLAVEQLKPALERGYYIHPELYGEAEEKGVQWARNPDWMRRIKDIRAKRGHDRVMLPLQPRDKVSQPGLNPVATGTGQ